MPCFREACKCLLNVLLCHPDVLLSVQQFDEKGYNFLGSELFHVLTFCGYAGSLPSAPMYAVLIRKKPRRKRERQNESEVL